MNTKKIALMAVAVVAIGIFALPSTVSLFAGQHVWYDLNENKGNDVPCKKCHADIYEEYMMAANGVHGTLSGGNQTTAGDDPDAACGACHRLTNITNSNANYTFASGWLDNDPSGSTPGVEAHAAATIACMACHQLNNTGNYPGAGGFNITAYDYVSSPYMYSNSSNPGTYAAHNAFIAQAINDTTLQDSNEACIACHTYIAVKINWQHARSLEFDVGLGDPITTPEGPHNWTMSNWDYNKSEIANVTVWGNTSGNGSVEYHNNWPGNVDSIYE
jgi:hypothetical protein